MKILTVLCFTAALMAAQSTPVKATPAKPASKGTKAAKVAPPDPGGLPKGAKPVGDFEWRWTDPKGKVWIYRKTPFGYAKMPETAPISATPEPVRAPVVLTAVDLGDQVEFSRPGPLGISRWTKKKTETLSTDEKTALDALSTKEKQ